MMAGIRCQTSAGSRDGRCMKMAPPGSIPFSGLPLSIAFVSLSTTRSTCSSSLCE